MFNLNVFNLKYFKGYSNSWLAFHCILFLHYISLLVYRSIGVSVYSCIGLLGYRSIGVSVYSCIGLSWCISLLVYWSIGVSVYRCIVCWCISLSVYQSIGVSFYWCNSLLVSRSIGLKHTVNDNDSFTMVHNIK